MTSTTEKKPEMKESVLSAHRNKLRVRVMGVHFENEEMLLVKHRGIGEEGILYIPPGGGVEFGESMTEALEREFIEETGLSPTIGPMLFVHEFISEHLHAVEVFFRIEKVEGTLSTGQDPEMSETDQIIEEARYFSYDEILKIPRLQLHQVLQNLDHPTDILNHSGYFIIPNNYLK